MPLLLWTRHSGVTVFPSARGSKKPLSRRGRKPEGLEQAPQRLRMAEWLLIHDLKRTFRLDSNQRGEDFPSARGTKNLNRPVCHCCAGLEPDGAWSRRPSACVWRSGYWFEPGQQIKQESPGRSPEDSCFMRSPDWTRTSNPSINSRMLCQLSYGGLFCFRCRFPLQRVITIPGLFGLCNLKCREVHHFWVVWLVWVVREASTPRYSPATCRTQDIRQVAGA